MQTLKNQFVCISQVIFSDETAIDVTEARSQYVRRGRGDRITPQHTAQHRPFLRKIMIWGSFSYFGPGRISVVQGTMTAVKYKATLEEFLLPQIQDWFPGEAVTFQHDNAPCHKAATVKDFLRQQGIPTMEWPPYSPDLSPIENLWAILKRKVHTTRQTTVPQLVARINAIWFQDEEMKQTCEALINSMPRRIEACIKAKGGPIKY